MFSLLSNGQKLCLIYITRKVVDFQTFNFSEYFYSAVFQTFVTSSIYVDTSFMMTIMTITTMMHTFIMIPKIISIVNMLMKKRIIFTMMSM